jgi:hypothetical protein
MKDVFRLVPEAWNPSRELTHPIAESGERQPRTVVLCAVTADVGGWNAVSHGSFIFVGS